MKKTFLISLLIIIFDQLIKLLVVNSLSIWESVNVINKFFRITFVTNKGAAFSILMGNRIFLIIASLLALIVVYNYLKESNLKKTDVLTYGILIGGIFGNLIDRIFRGYVVDYLDFTIFSYDFPVFNLADIAIVIGCILLIFTTLRGEKNAKINRRRNR